MGVDEDMIEHEGLLYKIGGLSVYSVIVHLKALWAEEAGESGERFTEGENLHDDCE